MKPTLIAVTLFSLQAAAACESIVIDGKRYDDVRWGAVTETAVFIKHKNGVGKIPLSKLSPEIQRRFGYDPSKVVASPPAMVPPPSEPGTNAPAVTPPLSPEHPTPSPSLANTPSAQKSLPPPANPHALARQPQPPPKNAAPRESQTSAVADKEWLKGYQNSDGSATGNLKEFDFGERGSGGALRIADVEVKGPVAFTKAAGKWERIADGVLNADNSAFTTLRGSVSRTSKALKGAMTSMVVYFHDDRASLYPPGSKPLNYSAQTVNRENLIALTMTDASGRVIGGPEWQLFNGALNCGGKKYSVLIVQVGALNASKDFNTIVFMPYGKKNPLHSGRWLTVPIDLSGSPAG